MASHIPAVRPISQPDVREQDSDPTCVGVEQRHRFGCIARFEHRKARAFEHVHESEAD